MCRTVPVIGRKSRAQATALALLNGALPGLYVEVRLQDVVQVLSLGVDLRHNLIHLAQPYTH